MRIGFTGPLVAILLYAIVGPAVAGNFKSRIIEAGNQLDLTVPDGFFLKVRNFTQDGGTDRGVVTATIDGQTVTVLTAARVETSAATATPTPTPTPTPMPAQGAPETIKGTSAPETIQGISALEPINSVNIAGPADVTIRAPSDARAFVTYRRESESD